MDGRLIMQSLLAFPYIQTDAFVSCIRHWLVSSSTVFGEMVGRMDVWMALV